MRIRKGTDKPNTQRATFRRTPFTCQLIAGLVLIVSAAATAQAFCVSALSGGDRK